VTGLLDTVLPEEAVLPEDAAGGVDSTTDVAAAEVVAAFTGADTEVAGAVGADVELSPEPPPLLPQAASVTAAPRQTRVVVTGRDTETPSDRGKAQ